MEEYVKDFSKKIIGIIRTESNGDLTALSFPGRKILGYYRKTIDKTTDFYGKFLYNGNMISALFNQ